MLLKKSQENKNIAEEAFLKGYYHIYVSRIYYSLYQKLMLISHEQPGTLKYLMTTNGQSHMDFIIKMAAYFKDKKNMSLYSRLMNDMRNLCRLRNKADYGIEDIGEDKANQVRGLFEKINGYFINEIKSEE